MDQPAPGPCLLQARSLALDALRRRPTERRATERGTLAPQLRDPPEPRQSGPGNPAVTGDPASRARTAVAGLTPGQRTALELAYLGGKTAAQVAQIQGIPVGTARSRIRAALLRLHQALAAGDEAAGDEAAGLEPARDGADGR